MSHIEVIFIQEIHEGLVFSAGGDDDDDYSFGIFSVKFSTDGQELIAASSDGSIYVYDLEGNKLSLRIPAHTVLEFNFCKYLATIILCLMGCGEMVFCFWILKFHPDS